MAHTLADVPEDFPHEGAPTVSGAQAKLLVQRTEDGYQAEADLAKVAAFTMCEDLAQQLASLCRRKAEELGSQESAVTGVFRGLLQKQWCTPRQAVWTLRRAVALLGWPKAVLANVVAPSEGVEMSEDQVRKLLRLDEPPAPRPDRPITIVEKALARYGLDWRRPMGSYPAP